MKLSNDFKELLQLFDEKGVEYLIVGGYAMAAHGHPRNTGDIDVWIRTDKINAEKIIEALAAFGFAEGNIEGRPLEADDFLTPDTYFQLGRPPLRVDIITTIDGVEFESCYKRKKLIPFNDFSLPIIALEDLILNKKASGRLRDLADIEELER